MAEQTQPLAVIDASTLAGVLFAEPEAAGLDLTPSSGRLIATTLLPHEFANICVKKHLRAGYTADEVLAKMRQFESLGVRIAMVSLPEVFAMAIRFQLSSYDAGYLWLALSSNLPLLTLDKKLGHAYQRALTALV